MSSYVDEVLIPGERVLHRARISLWPFAVHIIVGLVLADADLHVLHAHQVDVGLAAAVVVEAVDAGDEVEDRRLGQPLTELLLERVVGRESLEDGVGDKGIDVEFLRACGAKQTLHDDPQALATCQIAGPMLFDLCLDLFNRSEQWQEGDLWSDSEVLDFLKTVKPLVASAELVTVSMSFNYSGTPTDTRHLARLVIPELLAYRGST